MGAFKRGSFKLAVEAQAPVVPVSLIGLRAVAKPGRLVPGTVHVRIHEPLEIPEGPDAAESLTTRAEAIIRSEVE